MSIFHSSLQLYALAALKHSYYQSYAYSPTDALVSCLKNHIKIYVKTAPTCFGVTVTPPPVNMKMGNGKVG